MTINQYYRQLVGEAARECVDAPPTVHLWSITARQASDVLGVSYSYAHRLLKRLCAENKMYRRDNWNRNGTANEFFFHEDVIGNVQSVTVTMSRQLKPPFQPMPESKQG